MKTTELTNTDLHFVVTRLPKDVRALVAEEPSVCVAGGFIRGTLAGERPEDIDLFGPDDATVERVAHVLAVQRKARLHKTPNALTVLSPPRLPVQVIKRWTYRNPEEVVASFDFTVCQAAVWWEKHGTERTEIGPAIREHPHGEARRAKGRWRSTVSEQFYPDLAARRLVYTRPARHEDAGGSILRVRKYVSRGYNIQAGSLGRVVARLVMGVKDKGNGVFRDEPKLGKILTSLLREVDPLMVVDGIDLVDEHELLDGINRDAQA